MKVNTEYNVPLLSDPIGSGDVNRSYEAITDEGVTRDMCIPTESGGRPFSRHDMNGLAYASSIGTFLHQMGYPTGEMRKETAEKIGGFPKGAILSFIDDNGFLIEYVSKVDDNMADFPSYDGGNLIEDDYWKPVITTRQYVGSIDTDTVLASKEFSTKDNEFDFSMEIKEDSFCTITINAGSFSNNFQFWLFLGFPDIEVYCKGPSGNIVVLGTMQPVGNGGAITQTHMVCKGSTVGIRCSNFNSEVIGSLDCKIVARGITGSLT